MDGIKENIDEGCRALAPHDLRGIKVIRVERGIKQCDLALDAGITQAALSNLETGQSRAHHGTACKLAEALGISLPALLSYSERIKTNGGENK